MLISINEKKNLNVSENLNILQACALFNIYIPRFCYHEKLSIAGNCRMCLVEVKGVLKPIASCAMPISKDMQIFTDSKLVKKAREGILEFILLNHPLDCPICDQGGECDLQDQSLLYGNDKGRFYDFKRSVKDKDCGPLIKTIMTRCIQCTRCVRFMREISGLNFLGVIGRGNSMEISNFLGKSLFSELSGNVIDVCPVGALTSKPYSFVARPWELSSFNTIDLNDIMHVNIRVDVRDTKILRILPRLNSKLNENWISDITRFSYDGFFLNRLTSPYGLNNEKKIVVCSWLNILFKLKKIQYNKINFIFGNFLDAETNAVVKYICTKYGNFSFLNLKQKSILNDFRFNYFFNYKNFDNLNLFNSVFLFNTNLRLENPLLNLRLKKLVDKNLIKIFSFGSSFGYNFFVYNQGNSLKIFLNFIAGKSILNNFFIKSNKNLFIFNWSFFNKAKNNFDFFFFKNNNLTFLKNNIEFSVLSNDSTSLLLYDFNLINSINSFDDVSFKKIKKDPSKKDLFYLLNVENFNFFFKNYTFFNDNFVFFQSQYLANERIKNKIHFFLPSAHFVEKNATYVNFFGLIQKVKFILFPFKNVRSDSKIIYMLFKDLFNNKKVNNKNNFNLQFFFSKYNFSNFNLFLPSINFKFSNFFSFNNTFNISFTTNVYRSNSLSKRSQILNICYKDVKKIYSNFF
jgi:NADH-quinone oxidoreductase subunit G